MDVRPRNNQLLRLGLAYGALAFPLSVLGVTFYVYIPKYYSDVVGVPVATISFIILVSRIWDAVLDPIIGYWSDRNQSTWGRRKSWIFIAAPVLAVSFYFLSAPDIASGIGFSPSVWFVVWTMVFFFFWTLVAIPYEALGAELSFNYHERTSILSVREGALVLGTLASGLIPALYEHFVSRDVAEMQRVFGLAYGLLLVATAVILLRVPETPLALRKRPASGLWENIKPVFQNRPFLILLVAYTVAGFGAALPATLLLFYVEHVLKSDNASIFLVLYFGVGFLFLPLWVKLAAKFGKKQAWMLAMAINTGAFAFVYFIGEGQGTLFAYLVALSGVGYGATLVLPSSMQADVIDLDEFQSGRRREGQFVGLWTFSKKLAAALGTGLGLYLLSRSGYQPGIEQSVRVQSMLSFLYAGFPCICNVLAMVVAAKYPFDEQQFTHIRREIDERGRTGA